MLVNKKFLKVCTMDPSRVQRFGKPYYRSNYIPHNTRQTLEDRLHPPGISTSSNSSWTFSNSHCDIPKPKKGRLCGIFLIGAVLVVALAVIAIAGLAFYIGGYTIEKHHFSEYQTKDLAGAKRQYSTKQSQTTLKSVSRYTSKTSATTGRSVENLSTVSMQTKTIPEGAVLGISETMKQLNKGLRNKKKEEPITTVIPDDFSTEDLFEEKYQYDSQTENIEIVPEKLSKSSTTVTANDRIDESHAVTEYDSVKNGHARPNHVVETTATTTTTTTTSFADLQPPKRVYSDEPWRPIIPFYRDTMRVRNPYREEYQDKLFEHRHGVLVEPGMENDTPITFSRESYEQNLRITPEYAGSRDKVQVQNNPVSRISDQIAAKYKDMVKDHRIGSPESVAEVVVTSVDIITAPPLPLPRPSDIIIVSESSTSSALSVYYNATEESRIKEPQKPSNPVGLHQIISGINMAESEIKITKTSTSKPVAKTTQKISTQTTPKLVSTNITEDNTATTTTTVLTNKTTPETSLNTNFSIKTSTMTNLNPTTTHTSTEAITSSQSSPKNTIQTIQLSQGTTEENVTVKNPFLDDSRSVSSNFNFGIPELPILKQFHHLDSLFKSFSKPGVDSNNQYSKYFVRSDDGNEKAVTRFPARTKPTTAKSYKKDDTILYEFSTTSPEPTTTPKPLTRKPVVIKGEVEVVSGPIKHEPVGTTTEIPKLITLLPVRSNVNMMRPLRPRPKSNVNSTITIVNRRKSKMSSDFKSKELSKNESGTSEMLFSVPYQQKQFINDKNGKRWVYYSSSKSKSDLTVNNEKIFIVTPEPKTKTNELEEDEKDYGFFGNVTNLPLYNTIESLLNLDYRDRNAVAKNSTLRKPGKNNTSEIVDKIVKIVENVAISTGDSPKVIVKVNQTVLNRTTELAKAKNETTNVLSDTEIGLSTKAVASHYKLNQAGVPVLTKILNKIPAYKKEELPLAEDAIETTWNEEKGCGKNSFKCGNDTCLPVSKKCNQFIDCPDADDEQNCKCSEHLKAQKLHRKLCDGIVDCWDFSDEFNCEWCKEEILCSNSKVCIRKDQICDGINNCPMGDDERNCVTVSPSRAEADTFSYHHNGYLMVRKNGLWGKLCVDNFDSVSLKAKTGWKITDLGRTVCKALTFKDFDKVERMVSVPNEGRSFESNDSEKYYELAYNETSGDQHSPRESVLSFHETSCAKKEVVKVTCTDLECGLRPQATNQWSRKTFSESSDDELSYNSGRHSRIVGGGNASPGSWPWQAALYKEGEFQCGGTLISENWLISAGHCFHHNQDAYWVARLGTLRTTLLLPSPYEQLRKISKIILHPQYVDNGFINDISLLRMRDPVKFTDYVRPICLPKPYAPIVDGKICTVVGWGQLSEVGWIFPDTLQEVQLPILSSNECRKRTIFLPLYKVTDDMFCAGYDRGGRDACLGDSGGPLMCQEVDGRWSLFGVTSNGYGCGRSNRPGVYTKVSKYLNWINAQMNLHSEVLTPITDFEEKQYFSTSRSFTEDETTQLSENNEEQDVIIKQITQRLSNVKLNPENTKYKDKCKGHRCPLGECLPKGHVCDGHIECSDGSDEKDCW